jgi:hypothetical protein
MADSRVPCNPLESFKVPDDVKIRLAELELELSEGKYQNYSLHFYPNYRSRVSSSQVHPVRPNHSVHSQGNVQCFIHVLVLVNLSGDLERVQWCTKRMTHSHTFCVVV